MRYLGMPVSKTPKKNLRTYRRYYHPLSDVESSEDETDIRGRKKPYYGEKQSLFFVFVGLVFVFILAEYLATLQRVDECHRDRQRYSQTWRNRSRLVKVDQSALSILEGTSKGISTAIEIKNFSKYKEHLAGVERLFYNRVPKCGSETLMRVLQQLAKRNNFSSQEGWNQPPTRSRFDSQEQLTRFVKRFLEASPPMILTDHLYHIDFRRVTDEKNILYYVNLVRDPIERKISEYNYLRYRTDRYHEMPVYKRFMNLDDCVHDKEPECTDPNEIFVLLPYFCGYDPICRTNSKLALQRAKQNIVRQYVVIGILEDIRNYFWVLECILPHFFEGALDIYDHGRNGTKMIVNRTVRRDQPYAATVVELRKRLAVEYQLYYFIRARFNNLKMELKKHCEATA